MIKITYKQIKRAQKKCKVLFKAMSTVQSLTDTKDYNVSDTYDALIEMTWTMWSFVPDDWFEKVGQFNAIYGTADLTECDAEELFILLNK